MNREIKFRGKDLEYGCWAHGDLMQHNDGDVLIGIHSQHWTDDGYSNPYYKEVRNVDEDTVSQYTGLKDKNGVEIYEGDIMRKKPGKKYKGVVVWDKEKCRFQCEWTDGSMPSSIDIVIFNRGHVIGNVYDNPELIGVTK